MRRIYYRFKRNRACWGKMYPGSRRIDLVPSMDDNTMLEIALHEGLHVLFPIIDEQEIDNAGKSLADLLLRLGYRRKDEDE